MATAADRPQRLEAEPEVESAKGVALGESGDQSLRSEKLDELTRDLDRIRHGKLAVLGASLCWGVIVWISLLIFGAGLFFGLSAFDLFPSFELKLPVSDTVAIGALICLPLLAVPLGVLWAMLRAGSLKRRIAHLQDVPNS